MSSDLTTSDAFTPKMRQFLVSYRELGSIRHASEAAGCSRSMHSTWVKQSPAYAAAFAAAKEDAIEVLEQEARRRAVEGVTEPVGWYRGTAGGTVQRYSDTLLIFLLKGLKPETYRERVEVRASVFAKLNMERLPDAVIARLADGEHPAAVLASAGEEVRGLLLASGVELGGPGTDGGQDEGQAEAADDVGGDDDDVL